MDVNAAVKAYYDAVVARNDAITRLQQAKAAVKAAQEEASSARIDYQLAHAGVQDAAMALGTAAMQGTPNNFYEPAPFDEF